jgi:hypothetical protein
LVPCPPLHDASICDYRRSDQNMISRNVINKTAL